MSKREAVATPSPLSQWGQFPIFTSVWLSLSPCLRGYSDDHDYTDFWAQSRAPCFLTTSGFVHPIAGIGHGFATGLLAKLWSGGTWAVPPHTHWVRSQDLFLMLDRRNLSQ